MKVLVWHEARGGSLFYNRNLAILLMYYNLLSRTMSGISRGRQSPRPVLSVPHRSSVRLLCYFTSQSPFSGKDLIEGDVTPQALQLSDEQEKMVSVVRRALSIAPVLLFDPIICFVLLWGYRKAASGESCAFISPPFVCLSLVRFCVR